MANSKKKTRYRSSFYFEGKRYETTSSKSQREADQKAALKLDQLRRGEIGISSGMTVRAWAYEWLDTYKKPVVAQKQYDDYKRRIDNVIIPEIGSLRLTNVKDIHLQKILNQMQGRSLSDAQKMRITLRSMFKTARGSRLIQHDPSEFIVLPKTEQGARRSLTDFEREHFLRAARTHHAGLMFKLMLYCGLRTGEVVALDWRDIDFAKHRIKVSRAIESGSENIKAPKTAAGVREVPIPDEIYDELLARRGDAFAPVFLQPRGGVRHTHSSRRKAWDSLKKQIDISMGAVYEKRVAADGKLRETLVLSVVAPDLVPYCLRHTYCTDLQRKGVPINMAKYLMGHSDISVTANIYTHITDSSIDDVARLIGGNHGGNGDADIQKNS